MSDNVFYYDQEGNEYKDSDPHGVDISGKRQIHPTGKCLKSLAKEIIVVGCNDCLFAVWDDYLSLHICNHPNSDNNESFEWSKKPLVAPACCPLKKESLTISIKK